MDKPTHEIRCRQWTELVNACLASGMAKKDWCQANGISEKAFYYWQRILRNEAYITQSQMSATASGGNSAPVTFVELKPTTPAVKTELSFHPDIVLRSSNFTLEISNTASPELLKQLGGMLHAQ